MPAINFTKRDTKKWPFWPTFSKIRRTVGHFTMLFCKGRLRNVQRSSRCRCASRAQFLVTNALLWTVKIPTCPVQLAIFFCHSDHMKKAKSDNWTFFILRMLLANIKLSQPVTAVYCVPKQRRLHWYDVLNALVNWSIFKIHWRYKQNSHHQMEHTNVDVNRGHVKAQFSRGTRV